jgi:site-specific DNA recombinase
MLRDGRADGLLSLDLDRAARDPLDLEDLIDAVVTTGCQVESVTGTLRLTSTSDIATARIMVSVASKSSADTSRRIVGSRERAADEGRYLRSGRRKFGFEDDGVTVLESEAVIIKSMADDVLSGLTLRQLAADLRGQGTRTVSGRNWTPDSVRSTLLFPRYGGFLARRPVRNGKVISGHVPYEESDITGPAPWADAWKQYIPPDTWRAVRAVLLDPARRTSPGNTPRWLVSLIARCAGCDSFVAVGGGTRIIPAYRCRAHGEHLRVHAEPVDALVAEVVIARLSRPDAASLLPVKEGAVDLAQIRRDAAGHRARLDEAARMFGEGTLDASQLKAATVAPRQGLERCEAILASQAATSPLEPLIGVPDVAEVWAGLSIGKRRQVVRDLGLRITLHPGQLHARQFQPDQVQVGWPRKRRALRTVQP